MNQLSINRFPEPSYQIREAMNRLRINLSYCGAEYKNIMITSSVPGEGKSFVAMNLWRSLAESGKDVLLIDADIRKSALQTEFRLVPDKRVDSSDLVRFLAGRAVVEDVVYGTNIPGGYMVPVFRNMSNPAILFANPRFGEMVSELSAAFDMVLIDTPPLENVSDALTIAPHVDGSLLVVKGGHTPRKLIRNSINQLKGAKCTLIGTVLNQVEENASYYYREYKKYGQYSQYSK